MEFEFVRSAQSSQVKRQVFQTNKTRNFLCNSTTSKDYSRTREQAYQATTKCVCRSVMILKLATSQQTSTIEASDVQETSLLICQDRKIKTPTLIGKSYMEQRKIAIMHYDW